jgi:CBS domain containing-hemolysin-like protein
MVELVVAIVIVVVGSALCSGTEAALFSVSVIKVRQMAEEHVPAAKILLQIREKMSRPIATIVVLNNMFNIVGSIAVGSIAAARLGNEWVAVVSAILTFSVIIGSEIIPKTIGEQYAEPISLAMARPVVILTAVMLPLVWTIERLVSPITKGAIKPVTNEGEIRLLAQIGHQEGSIEGDEAMLIQRVFSLNDMTADMLMTPRVSLTYVHGSKTVAEARDDIIASPHTRILVIGESIDEVIGVALKDELLVALVEERSDQVLANLAREAYFVPEKVRADMLLANFQERREHLAVVVDEFGGLAGVVTLEDVLEVLTGEIVDETDLVADLQEWARQRREYLLSRRNAARTNSARSSRR